MNMLVNINGTLVPAEGPVIGLDNRAFHFGDGLFESLRIVNGRPCFVDPHWARLTTGAALLRITLPATVDRAGFERQILELIERSGIRNGRCRFTLYRSGGGQYRPQTNAGGYSIELAPLDEPHHTLNDQGLMVDLWPEMRKPINELSRHKTLNCQYYIMAALWGQERGLDDALLQNERGNIIESSSGNLFINLALANGVKVYECSLNPQNLLAADELFFTNAVRGIQWVGTYRTKRYTHRQSSMLMDLLVTSTLS
jgi:branched-chain amino acid aminotransferase